MYAPKKMTDLKIWIIKSRHKDPNDLYVKIDGSNHYFGFWVASARSFASAENLMTEAANDLNLGKISVVKIVLFDELGDITSNEIKERITMLTKKLERREDVQLAAWVSSNGGLW